MGRPPKDVRKDRKFVVMMDSFEKDDLMQLAQKLERTQGDTVRKMLREGYERYVLNRLNDGPHVADSRPTNGTRAR